MIHRHLGQLHYDSAWALQRELRAEIIADPDAPDVLLTVEHPPVLTAGRRARPENLLLTEADAAARGVSLRAVERGGDWTWHGPGQLVAYPIVALRRRRLAVKDFVAALQDSMAALAGRALRAAGAEEGYRVGARCGAPGTWITQEDGLAKVGAVGVHVSHGVTLHGLALNLDPRPWGFAFIVPCGLSDAVTTSLAQVARKRGGDPALLPAVAEAADWLAADLPGRLGSLSASCG